MLSLTQVVMILTAIVLIAGMVVACVTAAGHNSWNRSSVSIFMSLTLVTLVPMLIIDALLNVDVISDSVADATDWQRNETYQYTTSIALIGMVLSIVLAYSQFKFAEMFIVTIIPIVFYLITSAFRASRLIGDLDGGNVFVLTQCLFRAIVGVNLTVFGLIAFSDISNWAVNSF